MGFGVDSAFDLFFKCDEIKMSQMIVSEDVLGARIVNVFKVNLEIASAIIDPFAIASIIEEKGVQGLEEISIRPLIPLRPALCAHKSDLNKIISFLLLPNIPFFQYSSIPCAGLN